MKRREFLGRSALLAAAATGLQEPAAAQAGRRVFRWAFNAAETGFDPAQVSDLYSNYVISNIIEPPLQYDYLA
ncbi:MAG: bicyclomycin resistance protein, partial [Burkholderiaceae bacterium]|nr:bicyclomycin resistance protein [Burkholderiaceae bacterium]